MPFDPRLIGIFIGNPFFIIITVYILFAKIISRNKTYISSILGLFYASAIVSVAINIFYALLGLFNEGNLDLTITILYYITITLMFGAGIYLTVGTLLLYEKFSGKERDSKIIEIALIVIFYVLTIPSYFIFQGVKIGFSTENKPVWDIQFTIYYYVIIALLIIIPVYFFILKIRSFFKTNDVRLMKKWDFFIIGWTGIVIAISMNFLNYTFTEFGMIFSLINVIGLVLGTILIGYSYSECKK
ncbi:MAG: hypothetical protein KGD57_01975 [Candidatus Lokiarchaeota archaeon]|nr:hypothetical protein [Candidatus Lokiarchaeota archaeon]